MTVEERARAKLDFYAQTAERLRAQGSEWTAVIYETLADEFREVLGEPRQHERGIGR